MRQKLAPAAWCAILLFWLATLPRLHCQVADQAAAAALLAQKARITNWAQFAGGNNITGWDEDWARPDGVRPCQWTGVGCDAYDFTVTALRWQCDATGAGLQLCAVKAQGTLAPELANITTLQSLIIAGQLIGGPLPAAWGSVQAFRKLTQLVLLSNELTGSLPSSWSSPTALPQLDTLDLQHNQLMGPLPTPGTDAAGAFPRLATLRLGKNNFQGSLPPAWGTPACLPLLIFMSLEQNSLAGPLPAAWGSASAFRQLVDIDISENELTSSLPSEWGAPGALPELTTIKLFSNKLTGTLPDAWGAIPKLQSVKVDDNPQLCGTVPTSLQESVCNPALQLGTDCIGGQLPNCTPDKNVTASNEDSIAALLAQKAAIVNWPEFSSANNVTGWDALADVCQWTGVTCNDTGSVIMLDLSCYPDVGNQFCGVLASGTLAPKLADSRDLETLLLSNQNFTGTLPEAWASEGGFPRLMDLGLANNSLSGPLPGAYGGGSAFPVLETLDLSLNTLSGSLPSSWAQLRCLQTLSLADNLLTSTLPAAWGTGSAWLLTELNVSNNRLTGSVPPWGSNGSLSQLERLDLSMNRLAGRLPDTWPANSAHLTISDNELTGPLPEAWPNAFPTVHHLDLKNNQLSGQFPSSYGEPAAFPSLITLALDGNPGLCGVEVPATLNASVCAYSLDASACSVSAAGVSTIACAAAPLPDSAPIGAIVGGAVGGAALAAAAMFLALRWRKRRGLADKAAAPLQQVVPGVDPLALSLLEADASALPAGAVAALHDSQSISLDSLAADPLLTFIVSHLTGLSRHGTTAPGLPTKDDSGSFAAGSSAAGSGLSPDVQLWEVQWDSILLQRPVGRGSFGKVYLAQWNATPVAVKVLLTADQLEQAEDLVLPPRVMQGLQEEAAVMSRIRHPNVVAFMGLCTLPPCILTEYCSYGSLYDVLRQAGQDADLAAQLTWRLRVGMAFGAARGLLYLHARVPPIVHHDVKSPNLLVDEHLHVKVCDFNLSEILRQQPAADDEQGMGATNPRWLAPEVLEGKRATADVDVYAFGLVLWELLAWRLPWVGMTPWEIRRAVLDGRRPPVPQREELPGPDNAGFAALEDYCALMRECWAQDPQQRPDFSGIVARLGVMLGAPAPGMPPQHGSGGRSLE